MFLLKCNEVKEIPKEKETNEKPVEIVSEPSKDLEPDKGLSRSTNTGGKQSEVPSEKPTKNLVMMTRKLLVN
ncbi:hypothetical protein ONA02_02830 [Mycoplasmopsis felis]|nr:hypothetical protein [Mycoplasmopsis felis]MCU9937507.1 hypothetical protein [Mycoplasmopsis felis]UWV78074.1 hypothetical protein NWE59_03890 [Mycoplasmopsis felis]WAM02731.1 hypothetical protein ONA02_02830 [Mycoplasmopsis felis]